MANKTETILDASALLAALYAEPGAEAVRRALDVAAISTVNLAEVVGKLRTEAGWTKAEVSVGLDLPLEIVDFNEDMARIAGELLADTRRHGLSLGDRACLATALGLGANTVLTADTAWSKLKLEGLAVSLIR